MSRIKVGILGAGGFAREVWWALQDARAHESLLGFEPVMFIDREGRDEPLKGLPVRTLDDVPKDVFLVCGVGGMTHIKERIVTSALAAGFRFAPAIIAESARVGPDVRIGDGSIICAGTIATTDIEIGAHVAINLDCTIGHDAVIGDYVTASPGCHISGCVTIGRNAFLGTGASILEHVTIGEHAVLGAGAVATKDIVEHALAVGVPAIVKKLRNAA
jgi:sugar O-acyltransferase (sialic acid O-acetyltransferase NeuD family)